MGFQMGRSVRVATALSVLFLLVLGARPAVSQPPNQRTTITVFDPNATPYEKEVNEGSKKFGAGDWGVSLENLLDPESCEKVGQAILKFTFVKPVGKNDGFHITDGTAVLPDGKIAVYSGGKFSEFGAEDGADLPVIGGTGAYQDATGTMTVLEDQELCDRKGATLTFSLLLD